MGVRVGFRVRVSVRVRVTLGFGLVAPVTYEEVMDCCNTRLRLCIVAIRGCGYVFDAL